MCACCVRGDSFLHCDHLCCLSNGLSTHPVRTFSSLVDDYRDLTLFGVVVVHKKLEEEEEEERRGA